VQKSWPFDVAGIEASRDLTMPTVKILDHARPADPLRFAWHCEGKRAPINQPTVEPGQAGAVERVTVRKENSL